ncbi:hypothetical protein UVI_02050220 [Ustilaginoidea virens]|uniref:Uncharacterized protein n=1 Tax=Ustilaginoidea virens TaxID=1159556 RepID=A0A1B5KX27_USTVR|nr:hypothetical protein UVI_02050220 [Ustilaginoidea virens]
MAVRGRWRLSCGGASCQERGALRHASWDGWHAWGAKTCIRGRACVVVAARSCPHPPTSSSSSNINCSHIHLHPAHIYINCSHPLTSTHIHSAHQPLTPTTAQPAPKATRSKCTLLRPSSPPSWPPPRPSPPPSPTAPTSSATATPATTRAPPPSPSTPSASTSSTSASSTPATATPPPRETPARRRALATTPSPLAGAASSAPETASPSFPSSTTSTSALFADRVFCARLITYPSYTDKQLANGQVVTPDQSYAPANLN